MLVLASAFTVFMAVLLVWMDRALADHLEKRAQPDMEVKAPQTNEYIPEITLPEITIRPWQRKTAVRKLPRATHTTWQCTGV